MLSLQPSLSVTVKEYVPDGRPVNSIIESDDWISPTLLNEYTNGLEFPDAVTSILPKASPEHKLSVSTTELISTEEILGIKTENSFSHPFESVILTNLFSPPSSKIAVWVDWPDWIQS